MNILMQIYYKLFTKNKGLLKDIKDNRDYLFGTGIGRKILQKNGQWTNFLPDGELQKNPTETMSCTSQALLNCVEIINKRKWDETKNYSDRFLAKCSGTTRRGNSMRKVLEALRKYYGTVREKQWDGKEQKSWNEYYKNIPQNILGMAQLWIKEYNLEYESVGATPKRIMKALEYSPLYVAGFAWSHKNNIYQSYGNANHAFTIVGYEIGKYWLAFDSYSPHLKKLSWNYKFSYVRSIFLKKKKLQYDQRAINRLIARGFNWILKAESNGEIYALTDNGLKYISPQEWNKINVQISAENKKLIGISNEYYNKLLQ